MKSSGRSHSLTSPFVIEIEKLVFGGDGLGRFEGKVVFVPFAAPGDQLEVRPVEQKKGYTRAVVSKILRAGPGRIDPACPHFLRCGGCQWQHIEYGCQLKAKQVILEELFHHRFPETLDLPIVMKGSPEIYGYRIRARLQVRGSGKEKALGFFQHRSHFIEDIECCPLFEPGLNDALAQIRASGCSGEIGEEIEIAVASDGNWAAVPSADSPGEGDNILMRRAGGFDFATSPSAFFQANGSMLDSLIAAAVEPSTQTGSALDLFSGVGFFSLPLAREHREVIAIESGDRAHRLCVLNAERAGLANIQAKRAEVGAWLQATASVTSPAFQCVLLDPPRIGAGAEIMQTLGSWLPDRIVYVSCDPQTLVRDLAFLPAQDYRIASITGLDLFPQTYHFETVVHIARRK
jgi:23S rRNA (uracil1939-C5)-methyltransferase